MNSAVAHFTLAIFSVALFATSATAAEVPSGHRAALIIGNAKYDGLTLPGVGKSLDVVQRALEARGFLVDRRENLGEKELKGVFESFARSVPTKKVRLPSIGAFTACLKPSSSMARVSSATNGSVH